MRNTKELGRLKNISSFSLMLVIAGSSCYKSAPSPTAISGTVPQDTIITLERMGGCMIPICRDYKLTIAVDGAVIFERRDYDKTIGIIRGNIAQEKLKQLISEFEKAKYFSLSDNYDSKHNTPKVCDLFASEEPIVTTSIRISGQFKAIKDDHSCYSLKAPLKGLRELENKIDEIVNTKQWI